MYLLFKRFIVVIFFYCLTGNVLADSEKPGSRLEPINVEITTHLGDEQTFIAGDQVSFMLSLDKSAYIYLFYQDAANNIIQLLPNHKQISNHYQPGLFMSIPDPKADIKFTLQPPFGKEQLWAFATDKKLARFSVSPSANKLKQINQSIDKIRKAIKSQVVTSYGESLLTISVAEE